MKKIIFLIVMIILLIGSVSAIQEILNIREDFSLATNFTKSGINLTTFSGSDLITSADCFTPSSDVVEQICLFVDKPGTNNFPLDITDCNSRPVGIQDVFGVGTQQFHSSQQANSFFCSPIFVFTFKDELTFTNESKFIVRYNRSNDVPATGYAHFFVGKEVDTTDADNCTFFGDQGSGFDMVSKACDSSNSDQNGDFNCGVISSDDNVSLHNNSFQFTSSLCGFEEVEDIKYFYYNPEYQSSSGVEDIFIDFIEFNNVVNGTNELPRGTVFANETYFCSDEGVPFINVSVTWNITDPENDTLLFESVQNAVNSREVYFWNEPDSSSLARALFPKKTWDYNRQYLLPDSCELFDPNKAKNELSNFGEWFSYYVTGANSINYSGNHYHVYSDDFFTENWNIAVNGKCEKDTRFIQELGVPINNFDFLTYFSNFDENEAFNYTLYDFNFDQVYNIRFERSNNRFLVFDDNSSILYNLSDDNLKNDNIFGFTHGHDSTDGSNQIFITTVNITLVEVTEVIDFNNVQYVSIEPDNQTIIHVDDYELPFTNFDLTFSTVRPDIVELAQSGTTTFTFFVTDSEHDTDEFVSFTSTVFRLSNDKNICDVGTGFLDEDHIEGFGSATNTAYTFLCSNLDNVMSGMIEGYDRGYTCIIQQGLTILVAIGMAFFIAFIVSFISKEAFLLAWGAFYTFFMYYIHVMLMPLDINVIIVSLMVVTGTLISFVGHLFIRGGFGSSNGGDDIM